MAGRRNATAARGADQVQAIAEKLEAKLFHRFRDRQLLTQAFIHPSAVLGDVQSNQRLEFLGDRVLGLVVAEMLHAQYPSESEGSLARRFAALVRREALERIARELHFGDYLILAKGEEESGGRENSANLADSCEAVIAAIFVDGGYAAAARFIQHYWVAPMTGEKSPPRDPKSTLQEWAQAEHGVLPVYRLISRDGPAHAPHFEIEVQIGDFPGATASGGSKQAAEQAAAQILMHRLGADND
ncbi:MAG: ribonuclease III [Proteobacteria bacterium]|nr:ribonuclease III [Pseudomonadota bacterium]MDA1357351.1 ribonuclease III [Pseudomonadota bacterium]